MSDGLALPLPSEQLPDGLRRFCDPGAPAPARSMAARGVAPVKGSNLVFMLLQLGSDADPAIARSAAETLDKLPESVALTAASEREAHPAFLAALVQRFAGREDVIEAAVANPALSTASLERVARDCSERISERIAVNQQRLLGAPRVIEALYKNKHTRMSTADRLVELAARNDVQLMGIPAFKAHVEAIRGQLIPEPTDEPLPGDAMFVDALAEDERCSSSEQAVVQYDEQEEQEVVVESSKPLMMQIAEMTMPEKIRLALVGNAAARAFLVRDRNRTVAYAAVSSPSMTDTEAAAIAHSREVSEEILRYIGNKREWLRNHEVKHGLVFNPKTPVGIALRFVAHMREPELRALSRSRGVPQPVKSSALQKLEARQKRG